MAALLIVLAGFLVYSSFDDLISRKPHKRMPIQFAPGSVIYIRERSNSDPSTPGQKQDLLHHRTPSSPRLPVRWDAACPGC